MHRPAYLAGTWYPQTKEACIAAIERHARDTQSIQVEATGLIGPHAGWTYSGDAAAKGYAALAHQDIELVVIFGSHRGANDPHTIFTAEAWETPLGPIFTEQTLAQHIQHQFQLNEEPITTAFPDNGVELHLPFMRYYFPQAQFLMLGLAANKTALTLGTFTGELCRSYKTVFIGSTDLTHYGPNYAFSPKGNDKNAVEWVRNTNDRGFIEAALACNAEQILEHGIHHQSACCPQAAAAMVCAVQHYHGKLQPQLIDHYLSYDKSPAPSFVGYASITF